MIYDCNINYIKRRNETWLKLQAAYLSWNCISLSGKLKTTMQLFIKIENIFVSHTFTQVKIKSTKY